MDDKSRKVWADQREELREIEDKIVSYLLRCEDAMDKDGDDTKYMPLGNFVTIARSSLSRIIENEKKIPGNLVRIYNKSKKSDETKD